jgi:hypothetical protein
MSRRLLVVSFATLAVWLMRPAPAHAHRLDEYLQATRLSVDADHVGLEIDLTPGVSVAREAFGWIDTNRDGRISPVEAETYAREMLQSLSLSVDDRPVAITLLDIVVPQLSEMSLGLGTIRIRASAHTVPAGWGRHHLSYVNAHKSDSSVYLVNVLVPADPRIEIGRQRRDAAQHGLTFDYSVMPVQSWSSAYTLFAGLMMAGALGMTRWPRRR